MDLDMTDLLNQREFIASTSAQISTFSKANNLSDTTLRLDCLGYESSTSEKPLDVPRNCELHTHDDGCRLVLGLGPTPNFYSADNNTTVFTKPKEPATSLSQNFSGSEFGMLELGLSRGNSYAFPSVDTRNSHQTESPPTGKSLPVPIVDEGSTSAKRKSGGYMPTLLFAPRLKSASGLKAPAEAKDLLEFASDTSAHHDQQYQYLNQQLQFSPETSAATDSSLDGRGDPSTYGSPADQRTHHPKKCRFNGCSKGARGASGLCIAHGGGQRCQKPGCNKGAESRTAYCKAHGGGRRCQQLGCTKSAEGKTDFCIAHGGGRRCGHTGCSKAARGKSGLCIRHGGGKRCTVEGCTRSAEGQAGRCISHGGGRRCQYQGCNKGAQGSTMYCKSHGGGKRCIFEGCTKGAEGSTPLCKGHGGGKRCLFEGGGVCPKSVHGGTNFCVAHGGGKRCSVPGCTKSARGRTDCCVRHGGGKRCKFEGCGKSAQGSTDFCKAHGGGKRCSWIMGCEKFARGKSGLCAAHGSLMVAQKERESGTVGSMIGPDLFQGIVSTSSTQQSSKDNEVSSSGVSSLSDCMESMDSMGTMQHLIPPQVLVPQSMKSSSSSTFSLTGEYGEGSKSQDKHFGYVVPEGRVHGGGLMSLLGRNLENVVSGGKV
ncbi:loricrin-like [Canna indica]|uniref:Loricrin-like n=1 Tax=Canna indica TaxID=4628 RepID=A0AAQ3JVE0_9LILI|nr:loricrin-like [Canna indica]